MNLWFLILNSGHALVYKFNTGRDGVYIHGHQIYKLIHRKCHNLPCTLLYENHYGQQIEINKQKKYNLIELNYSFGVLFLVKGHDAFCKVYNHFVQMLKLLLIILFLFQSLCGGTRVSTGLIIYSLLPHSGKYVHCQNTKLPSPDLKDRGLSPYEIKYRFKEQFSDELMLAMEPNERHVSLNALIQDIEQRNVKFSQIWGHAGAYAEEVQFYPKKEKHFMGKQQVCNSLSFCILWHCLQPPCKWAFVDPVNDQLQDQETWPIRSRTTQLHKYQFHMDPVPKPMIGSVFRYVVEKRFGVELQEILHSVDGTGKYATGKRGIIDSNEFFYASDKMFHPKFELNLRLVVTAERHVCILFFYNSFCFYIFTLGTNVRNQEKSNMHHAKMSETSTTL